MIASALSFLFETKTDMHRVDYNSPNRLRVGSELPVRVHLSFGLEMLEAARRETAKVERLLSAETRPDLMMDFKRRACGSRALAGGPRVV